MKLIIALLLAASGVAHAEYVVSGGASSSSTVQFGNPESAVGEASWLIDALGGMDISVGVIGAQDDVARFSYLSVQKQGYFDMRHARLFYGAGVIGRTYADGIDNVLSSPVSFSLSAGVDWKRLRFQYRHASNAGLKSPNHGQNWLLLGWRFGE